MAKTLMNETSVKKAWSSPVIGEFKVEDITHNGGDIEPEDGGILCFTS